MEIVRTASDFQALHGVSRETMQRLEIYAETLMSWQKAINLVSPATLGDAWQRHFSDSAQLLKFVPVDRVGTWLDLGSGAGFPGLVVAAMLAEKNIRRRVVLVDSDAKKCAFLREVARKMALGPVVTVDILAERIESTAVSTIVDEADVVSARALSSLSALLQLGFRFFGDNTVGVFPKGKDVDQELAQARIDWEFDVELQPSLSDEAARIVLVRNLRKKAR